MPRKKTSKITTFPKNGGVPTVTAVPQEVPVGEAIRLAIEELGDVKIDDALAPEQMRQLAECYENVVRNQAEYARRADAAKVAKKAVESSTELLLERVKAFTHPVPLPLFDAQQAEADRAAMVKGAS